MTPFDGDYVRLGKVAALLAQERPQCAFEDVMDLLKRSVFAGEFEPPSFEVGETREDPRNWLHMEIEAPRCMLPPGQVALSVRPKQLYGANRSTITSVLLTTDALPGEWVEWEPLLDASVPPFTAENGFSALAARPARSNSKKWNNLLHSATCSHRIGFLFHIMGELSRFCALSWLQGLLPGSHPMNFQQLRIVRETVRRNFNLTEVANSLFTSQSGVSKHIKDLEDELGVELFVRRGKRLLGLTDPGKEMIGIVERVLVDTASIKKLGEQFSNREQGQLVIATTHTQARYVLPHVVAAFRTAFPKAHLTLHHLSPTEIAAMVGSGEADIGICTETLREVGSLTTFPFYNWHHGVAVPKGHALERTGRLTLEAIAEWPIITYHEGFTGRANIDRTFAEAGLAPDIVMSAMDTDVLKAYVELGLGVGIIAAMAFDSKRDSALRLMDAAHLFATNTSLIAVRRGSYLRNYAYRFIELFHPRCRKQ